MSCEQLFKIFEKSGGKLQCNYDNKICFINNTKMKCRLAENDSDDVDWLLWSNAPFVRNIYDNIDRKVPQLHRYQADGSIGFTIEK